MFALIERNLTIYFKNHIRVFYSMLGSLISIGIYLLFLKNQMQSSWQQVPNTSKLLDPWLISGTLTVTAITTSFAALSQMVIDRENHSIIDIELTDIKKWQILAAYLTSAVIISAILQTIAFVIMQSYFQISDHITNNWNLFPQLLVIIILNSFVWTSFALILCTFFKKEQSFSALNSIIGTASGFFAGVYLPISTMPTFAQNIIKMTPAPYTTSLYRHLLMEHQLNKSFRHVPSHILQSFKNQMGITLKIKHILSFNETIFVIIIFTIVFIVITLLINVLNNRHHV